MAIYWLWIVASKSLTNYLIYKTKHCGASIDAWGVAALTQIILPIKAANTSNMGNSVAHPLDYTRCNTQNRWRSVDAHVQTDAVTMSRLHLHRTAANTFIMDICHSTAIGIYMMQHPKALTLCWNSVDTVLMLCWRSVDALLMLCWHSVVAHFEV
jgi:hypothetical protein